jgi:catechol 2,3-dioxygenase-like lactoylglutathione lyase family enzyme
VSVSPRLDLVGIVTNDLARSLAFYRTLGLDIPETPADAPHVEFTFDGGLRLAWDALSTIASFDPDFAEALDGLQTMTIIAAAPFVLVMIGLCFSLYKDLSHDPIIIAAKEQKRALLRPRRGRRVGKSVE